MASIKFDVWTVLLIIGAIQGYFLSVILFSMNRGRRTANICLGLLILSFSLLLTQYVVRISGLYLQWPHLIAITNPLWYLIGPLSLLEESTYNRFAQIGAESRAE